MPKPRLLFVSPRFLFPTDSGGKIRTTQVLRGLKGGKFEVRLLMPTTAEERRDWPDEIAAVCDDLLTWQATSRGPLRHFLRRAAGIVRREPIPVLTDWDSVGAARIAAAMAEPHDVVVFDFPHSAILAPEALNTPSVMFTHNVEAEIFYRHWQVAGTPLHRWLWRDQYRKMRRFEQETLKRFDTVVAVSERDCEFFEEDYGIRHCGAIPTGVDTDFFAWQKPRDEPQVVFCGSMDWMANIDGIEWFAHEVWPKVRAEIPEARMKVVGRSAPESLIRRVCKDAPEWEFTGFVDDVRDHVGGAAAFVIPLRVGGGTRIKAFEAMSMGTPVVATSIGIEGLPVEDNIHYLAADDPDQFAARLVALLRDSGKRNELSVAARRLVESEYGFRAAASVFEGYCVETANRA